MYTAVSQDQIDNYRENGFVVIDTFLDYAELMEWREAVDQAELERNGLKSPGTNVRIGDADGINTGDAGYFGNVFDQLLNLWQTSGRISKLTRDPKLGEMACRLSGSKGIPIWHDQALYQRRRANPTTLRVDVPFWSFDAA